MLEIEKKDNVLIVRGEARLKNVEDLFQKIFDFRDDQDIREVSLAELEDIDVAGAQILVSYLKTSPEIVLCGANESLKRKFEYTGISQFIR